MNSLKKHDTENGDRAEVVFKSIPEQLMNHNSVFRLSVVDENARTRNSRNAINFLNESMMVNNCVNVTKLEVTLEMYAGWDEVQNVYGRYGFVDIACT